ncbi:hypothetical protein [Nitratireductor pacificus]|uniref:Uncharacterized protein n=1 Tax=Nitratireductor pacificus pht-3B TaxID=391937 RepID=K2MYX8_9HYPH|nr:hypothetical protein [Nitratireductor pacificus]EKF17163.1 hypothetical protein NA2_19181 [Nitratireductor pacificus pht-3B]
MPYSTLHELTKSMSPATGGHGFLKSKKRAKPNKPIFTIPKMKQVAKLAEGMGKTVTTFTVNGDGGFTLVASEPGATPEAESNEWDEVLPNGKA